MSALTLFNRLDSVAVETQKFDIVSTRRDFFVERNAIFLSALFSPSSINVIDFKYPFIVKTASLASTTKSNKRFCSSRSITLVAAFVRKMSYLLWMRFSPTINASLLPEVVTPLAVVPLRKSGLRTLDAGFAYGHETNPTCKRTEKEL